jgi:hypothetical protein
MVIPEDADTIMPALPVAEKAPGQGAEDNVSQS